MKPQISLIVYTLGEYFCGIAGYLCVVLSYVENGVGASDVTDADSSRTIVQVLVTPSVQLTARANYLYSWR